MSLFDTAKVLQSKKISDMSSNEMFKNEINTFLRKFIDLDWGDTPEIDSANNKQAIKNFDFILAVYESSEGRIWITAESSIGEKYDRITILFPNEY